MKISVPVRLDQQAIRERENHFPLFLLTALLPILLFPFASSDGTALQRLLMPFLITLLVIESIKVLPDWMAQIGLFRVNGVYRTMGLVSALAVWWPLLSAQRPPFALYVLILVLRSLFFLLTAIRIIHVLANCERVGVRTLCLGAAGYVHLGLTAGLLATVLQLVDSDSFNLGANSVHQELMVRLSYFAFVTLGSLGYGDIVPVSPIGEAFAVLLSIASTLYMSLLIGLLLSRYIGSSHALRLDRSNTAGERDD
jgi:hypothetical protein